jgi:hypothetical protein
VSVADERRVHHLRLRSPAGLAERARFQIEDALRTASLGDNPRELILVRRIDLGPIRADAPPGVIARLLEQRWAQTTLRVMQWAGAESDPELPAVRFASLQAALVALARQLARGRPHAAWFWRVVLFGRERTPQPMDRHAAARAVISRVLEEPREPGVPATSGPALLAFAAFLADLLDTGDAVPFVALVEPQTARSLLFDLGLPAVRMATAETAHEPPAEIAPPAGFQMPADWRTQIQHAAETWTIADPRVGLLAAAAICARQPWRATELFSLTALTAAAIESLRHRPRMVREMGLPPPPEMPARVGAPECTKGEAEIRAPLPARDGPSLAETAGPPAPAMEQLRAAQFSAWQNTDFAGLYYLAVALQRLGAAGRASSGAAAVHVLVRLAHWSGAAESDPVLAPLLAAELPPVDEGQIALWSRAVRRYLRRRLRLRWMTAISRPGRISWTRTHIDVAFDVGQADVRIRRAGLDINPGWVLWLGRVLSFHYVDI